MAPPLLAHAHPARALVAHSAAAVRSAERSAVVDAAEGALMQRAAAAVAAVVAGELKATGGVYGRPVSLLVGSGDNGGDALLAGASLARRGAAVTAHLAGAPGADGRAAAHGPGLAALLAAGGRVGGGPSTDGGADTVAGAEAVVDGLLGTGARPGLTGAAAALAAAAREARERGALVVAVDLPSGVDPESGELPGEHVVADTTVTMGAAKPALLLPPASAAAGVVRVVALGLAADLLGEPSVVRLDDAAAAAAWPVPGGSADKYGRGVLGVVAGGDSYTGAAVLCVGAAVHAGVGMLRFVGAPHPAELVRARWPEAVTGTGRVQAWLVGPGLDLDPEVSAGGVQAARAALRAAVDDGTPLVVDAGALPLLAERVSQHGPLDPAATRVLVTPHAGELARLLAAVGGSAPSRADVEARPLHHARRAADATGATVLLKGATTLVVPPRAPGGPGGVGAGVPVHSQADGPPWLATAGTGDVLAGIAGALLAAGLPPATAGALASLVHGRAAHAANPGGPVSASAVSAAVPGAVAALLRGAQR